MNEIWALVEVRGRRVQRTSLGALCEAVRLGKQLRIRTTAVVIGEHPGPDVVESIGAYGADRVLVAGDDAPAPYPAATITGRLEHLLRSHRPDVLLAGGSAITREVAPRLAYRLGCGLVTEATFLRPEGDRFVVTRPAFRPHTSMLVSFRRAGLQIIVLASHVAEVARGGSHGPYAVEQVRAPSAVDTDGAVKVEAVVEELSASLDLGDADVIVAGGRGMQSRDGFALLDELAAILGGTVGATRMAVDRGWLPRSRMVGVSGRLVSPELYVACGISGAMQHVMGMRRARTIVAINTDPAAPIFRIATLGIVGDVRAVLPVMIDEFRRHAAQQAGQAA